MNTFAIYLKAETEDRTKPYNKAKSCSRRDRNRIRKLIKSNIQRKEQTCRNDKLLWCVNNKKRKTKHTTKKKKKGEQLSKDNNRIDYKIR